MLQTTLFPKTNTQVIKENEGPELWVCAGHFCSYDRKSSLKPRPILKVTKYLLQS